MKRKFLLVASENVVKDPDLKEGPGCFVVWAEQQLPFKV